MLLRNRDLIFRGSHCYLKILDLEESRSETVPERSRRAVLKTKSAVSFGTQRSKRLFGQTHGMGGSWFHKNF
jgi:hypothetical protein